jgi:hypothetical protein
MLDYMKCRLKEVSTWKGIIGVVGSVVMYFTPDNIDQIIVLVLGLLGVTDIFTIEKKDIK